MIAEEFHEVSVGLVLGADRLNKIREIRDSAGSRRHSVNFAEDEEYIAEFNQRFRVKAAQPGTAFTACRRHDLEQVFCLQFERTVSRDNTVSFQNFALQIQPVRWRGTLAGCTVTVHQHLDGMLSLRYGPHLVGCYNAQGWPLEPITSQGRRKAVAGD